MKLVRQCWHWKGFVVNENLIQGIEKHIPRANEITIDQKQQLKIRYSDNAHFSVTATIHKVEKEKGIGKGSSLI